MAKQRSLETAASLNFELHKSLKIAKSERDHMQQEFDSLMKQPFFREQADSANLQILEKLQSMLDQKEREVSRAETNIKKLDNDTLSHKEMMIKTEQQKLQLEEELFKMKQQLDPSSINLNDMMRKLKSEDPNNFRQVMSDLQYHGRDPSWFR